MLGDGAWGQNGAVVFMAKSQRNVIAKEAGMTSRQMASTL